MPMLRTMTVKRLDNVGIVVQDLPAAIAFFTALGLGLEGKAQVGGAIVDRLVALDGVTCDLAVMRTPDGHGRIELMTFLHPMGAAPGPAAANTPGIRRLMFAVTGIDDCIARLRGHGGEPLGEVVQYGTSHRLCYVRGPEGILIALAEELR
jgi:catechol 2,3-dioxygenase-like lactoylglutathione lyase family enzyme